MICNPLSNILSTSISPLNDETILFIIFHNSPLLSHSLAPPLPFFYVTFREINTKRNIIADDKKKKERHQVPWIKTSGKVKTSTAITTNTRKKITNEVIRKIMKSFSLLRHCICVCVCVSVVSVLPSSF